MSLSHCGSQESYPVSLQLVLRRVVSEFAQSVVRVADLLVIDDCYDKWGRPPSVGFLERVSLVVLCVDNLVL